jgi:hypothetical protein
MPKKIGYSEVSTKFSEKKRIYDVYSVVGMTIGSCFLAKKTYLDIVK